MAFTLVTAQTILARNAGVLYGLQLGAVDMAAYSLQMGTTPVAQAAFLNSVYTASVGTATVAAVADVVVTGLGIKATNTVPYKFALDYVIAQLNTAAATKTQGSTINDIITLFSNLSTADTTWGPLVTAYNNQITNALTYASTTGTANSNFANVSTTIATGTGSTFTLTTGVDTVGTNSTVINGLFNDTANTETWNLTDTVSGTAGTTDTLTVTVVGDANGVTRAGLQTTGIEDVIIKYVDGDVAIQATALALSTGGFTGLTKLTVKDASIANTTAGDADTITLTGIAKGVALEISNNSAAANVTATYASAATSSSADTVTIALAGINGSVTVGTGFETVALTSSGTTGRITGLTTSSAKTVTLAGTGLKIDGIMDATITTFDGSTSTGPVDVFLTSGTTLTSAKGGSGTADILAVNSLATTTTLAGFETLLAAGATGTYDLTNAVGVTGLGVNIGTTSSAFNNAAATQNTISVNAGAQRTTAAAATGSLAAGTITYGLKTATGLTDAVNFNVSNGGTASTGTITVGALTATAVETINISVADWKAANLTLGTVAATGTVTAVAITVAATATNLTLNTITITHPGLATLVDTINLSAVTGTTSSTMGGTGTLLFTGGTGVDTTTNGAVAAGMTQTFNLGAGADVFNLADTGATSGNVILDAGAGADTINAGATFQSTGTTNKIDGGADSDTLIFTGTANISSILDIVNVEKIQAQATGAVVSGTSVTGDTIEVTSFGVTTARLGVLAVTAGETVNLANFTFTGPAANQGILLVGTTGAEVLTGTLAADVITGNAGADVMNGGLGIDTFVYAATDTVFDTINGFTVGEDLIDWNVALKSDNNAATAPAAGYLAVTGAVATTTITGGTTAVVYEFANAADQLGEGTAGTFSVLTATTAQIKAEVIKQLATDTAVALTTGTANQNLLFVMYDESGNAAVINFIENEGVGTTIDAADTIEVVGVLSTITLGAITTANFI